MAGKPFEPMAALVRARLGSGGTMVGDRVDTDGLLAHRLGYRFVLVLTGSTSRRRSRGGSAGPTARTSSPPTSRRRRLARAVTGPVDQSYHP